MLQFVIFCAMIARYLVLGDEMAIVYLEDLSDRVGNKYLAVNMIAQRARVLNDRNLQFLNPNSKKCVTEALEEVVEHKIEYRRLEQPSNDQSDPFSLFSENDDDVSVDETKSTDKSDDLFDQIYLEDTGATDDEVEERL